MTYKLTEAIKNNHLRGLGLSQKFNTEITQILKSTDEVSLDEVKQLYTFLNKQQEKYEPKVRRHDGSLTKDTIDYIVNGGSSALAFCKCVLRDEGILKTFHKSLTDPDTSTEEVLQGIDIRIVKKSDDEKRLATFVVLEPQDDGYMTTDLHGDWYDAETVEKSCRNFNKYCMKANLLHLMPTSVFEFVESYISQADMVIGETFIKKGTWLATIHVDDSDLGEEIWQGIKSGYFNGLSIQCKGRAENIED